MVAHIWRFEIDKQMSMFSITAFDQSNFQVSKVVSNIELSDRFMALSDFLD